MASRKELRNRQSSDATPQVVSRQDHRSKEPLIDPHANERFSASSLWELLRFHSEFRSTTDDLAEHAFAFESQLVPVTAELVPYLDLCLRAVRGARDIPFLQSRVKPRKIGKLPRHGRGSAAYRFRQLYYQRIADMDSTERYFAVKVEGDDQFFASPSTIRHLGGSLSPIIPIFPTVQSDFRRSPLPTLFPRGRIQRR